MGNLKLFRIIYINKQTLSKFLNFEESHFQKPFENF